MLVPLQLTFRDVPPARQAEIEERVRQRAAKLERFFERINSCRVAIERPHQFERSGNPYRVRIDITVPPGHELVVRKEPGDHGLHTDLVTVVNAAFDAAERRLDELLARMRGEVKVHESPRAAGAAPPPDAEELAS